MPKEQKRVPTDATRRMICPRNAESITSRPPVYLGVTHLRYLSSLAQDGLWLALRSTITGFTSTATCNGWRSTNACWKKRGIASNPLLERVKFLAITANNLDEFVEIRVSSFLQKIEHGSQNISPDGLTTAEELAQLSAGHAPVRDGAV